MIHSILVASTLLPVLWCAAVLAQPSYPVKPVRLISPYAPGGGNDILCRIVAQKLTEGLKQQVIVENRPGANSIVGAEVAARAAPDGYTLVLVSSVHTTNASLYRKLPYDSVRDFTTISWSAEVPSYSQCTLRCR